MKLDPGIHIGMHLVCFSKTRCDSCHVQFGFIRHHYTVSALSPSSGIETRRARMCWKGDDDAVVLVLVPAPEGSCIILCDHDKVLCHLFVPSWLCIVSGLKPRLWKPPGRPLVIKTQLPLPFSVGFCLFQVFCFKTVIGSL
jgi:hypothetical protein